MKKFTFVLVALIALGLTFGPAALFAQDTGKDLAVTKGKGHHYGLKKDDQAKEAEKFKKGLERAKQKSERDAEKAKKQSEKDAEKAKKRSEKEAEKAKKEAEKAQKKLEKGTKKA